MDYRTIIENARNKGVTSEKVMWSSIARIDGVLDTIKDEHPDLYWNLLRDTHEELYGPHYDKEFAEYGVNSMHCTDKDGKLRHGAFWTLDEILAATKNKTFPAETTNWDKYVAYNACANDFGKAFEDEDVLEIAYMFFFDDEDAPSGKIWKYIIAMMY